MEALDLEKASSLSILINHHPDIDKSSLYVQDPYKAKYQFLTKKREDAGIKHYNDSKAFTGTMWMIFTKILKKTAQTRNVKY